MRANPAAANPPAHLNALQYDRPYFSVPPFPMAKTVTESPAFGGGEMSPDCKCKTTPLPQTTIGRLVGSPRTNVEWNSTVPGPLWAKNKGRVTSSAIRTQTTPKATVSSRVASRMVTRIMPFNDHLQRCEPAADIARILIDVNGWLASAGWCGSAPSFLSQLLPHGIRRSDLCLKVCRASVCKELCQCSRVRALDKF